MPVFNLYFWHLFYTNNLKPFFNSEETSEPEEKPHCLESIASGDAGDGTTTILVERLKDQLVFDDDEDEVPKNYAQDNYDQGKYSHTYN